MNNIAMFQNFQNHVQKWIKISIFFLEYCILFIFHLCMIEVMIHVFIQFSIKCSVANLTVSYAGTMKTPLIPSLVSVTFGRFFYYYFLMKTPSNEWSI